MKFVNLNAQFKSIETEIRDAINRVLEHGQFVMGPEISQLEDKLAQVAGVHHAITVSSGTDALLMALMAKNIGPGDAVFTTPFTFIATAEVVSLLGATPVFVDIDAQTFNIDAGKLDETILRVEEQGTLTPRAVIPVDLFGLPADYNVITPLAKKHDLFLLADAAQSFGARYHAQPIGSLGDVATTSFFPAKPLGCYGDGGAVFTDDDKLAELFRSIRIHGTGQSQYDNIRIGLCARFDTIQAAILLCKLAVFPAELLARQRIAQEYSERLRQVVKVPQIPTGCVSAWAQYSILSQHRLKIQKGLAENGIPTAIYYPKPLHLQGAFRNLGYKAGDFPVSEAVSEQIISLPMHPYLSAEEIDLVTKGVLSACQ